MDEFITKADNQIKYIVGELGWQFEKFINEASDEYVLCENNAGHRVLRSKLSEHRSKCDWASAGNRADDIAFPPSLTNGPSSFVMTPLLQEEIIDKAAANDVDFKKGPRGEEPRPVPQTSNKLVELFTQDERRALYDHVIANTRRETVIPPEEITCPMNLTTDTKREMTALELAAAERDAKRRRTTYRNKVHTNRKTHTEIIKEVIESQMSNMIDESIKKEPKCTVEEKPEHLSKNVVEKRERYENGRHSHHEGYRERSRDRSREYRRSYSRNRYDYERQHRDHRSRSRRDRHRETSPHYSKIKKSFSPKEDALKFEINTDNDNTYHQNSDHDSQTRKDRWKETSPQSGSKNAQEFEEKREMDLSFKERYGHNPCKDSDGEKERRKGGKKSKHKKKKRQKHKHKKKKKKQSSSSDSSDSD